MNEPRYQRLGPVHLMPGVSVSHALTYMYSAFVAIGLLTFFKTIQPFLFNVTLHVPLVDQGKVTASLEVWQELVVLATVGPFGALADRIGRRPVYAMGFVLLGVGYALFPLAQSVLEFGAYRAIFAAGAAATGGMLATVLVDYPQDRSRESMTAIAYVMNGLGVVLFAVILAKLPNWIQAMGASEVWAGRCALFTVAALCLISALAMRGLKPGVPARTAQQEPLLLLMRKGMAAARNPRIALAYGTAFASRGDIAVVGTYLALWSSQAAVAAGGGNAASASTAGMLTAVVQGTALLWAGIFGAIASKLNRVTALAIAMALAAAGYTLFGLVPDPNAKASIGAAMLLGIGQMSAILSSQVLIGQEAPAENAGSVLGMYGFFGAAGILFVSALGGWLFDAWRPGAPFLVMAVANVLLWLWALWVRRMAPGPVRGSQSVSEPVKA